MTYMGKESKKEWIYVYLWLKYFAVHLKHNIINQPYPINFFLNEMHKKWLRFRSWATSWVDGDVLVCLGRPGEVSSLARTSLTFVWKWVTLKPSASFSYSENLSGLPAVYLPWLLSLFILVLYMGLLGKWSSPLPDCKGLCLAHQYA